MKIDKYAALKKQIAEYTKQDIIIAFSGGVDSSLLLKLACSAAKENGTKVYAVTAQTRLHPAGDIEIAKKVAEEAGAVHKVLRIDELEEAGIKNNPKDRCYRCKKSIFTRIKNMAESLGVLSILEGTNENDLHEYRPGIKALKELGIISPLADNRITKEEVRVLAAELKISTADRPSMPCLATRLPYGTMIHYELLKRIEEGEKFIHRLGYYNVRLRIHGNIARIEVDESEIPKLIGERKEITAKIKKLGFPYVTLDLVGFRSGSMDLFDEDKQKNFPGNIDTAIDEKEPSIDISKISE